MQTSLNFALQDEIRKSDFISFANEDSYFNQNVFFEFAFDKYISGKPYERSSNLGNLIKVLYLLSNQNVGYRQKLCY